MKPSRKYQESRSTFLPALACVWLAALALLAPSVALAQDPPKVSTMTFRQPADGQVFKAPATVSIELVAVDPNGDIRHVEFFANDRSIGRSDHLTKDAVIPGNPRTHFFDWKEVGGGRYRLVAKATDTIGVLVESAPVTIVVEPVPTDLPVVSIVATRAETSEPSITSRIAPGIFTLKRTGDPKAPLSVVLRYDGTATPGLDYDKLPITVTFDAGVAQTDLTVAPLDDVLVEGDETVAAYLAVPIVANAPAYVIDPQNSAAKVVIHDNDSDAGAGIVITEPKDGEVFGPGSSITINATAVDPRGYIPRVEFFDGEAVIGFSEIDFFAMPAPGTPIYHSFEWAGAGPGPHVLTVRSANSAGEWLVSKAVTITVNGSTGNDLPVVSIAATRAETAEPSPTSRIAPGIFTLKRTGDPSAPLNVLLRYEGTATPGVDYGKLPTVATFEAGAAQLDLVVAALGDDQVERDETVVAYLAVSPLGAAPAYTIDPKSGAAKVVIHDTTTSQAATIEITAPKDGQIFASGATVTINATAIDPRGYISRLEFYDREILVGVSEIAFLVAPLPGTPIYHTFDWAKPAPGEHILTASVPNSAGEILSSKPVRLVVDEGSTLPVVGVTFEALPEAYHDADYAYGAIKFTRSGPTDNPLTVYFKVGGSATSGLDYLPFEPSVTIPAGSDSQRLKPEAIDDKLAEGDETIEFALVPPLDKTVPPFPTGYSIDPDHASAAIVIRDNDQTTPLATLDITDPKEGQVFRYPGTIVISATAIDQGGEIHRVEFYDAGTLVGVSEPIFPAIAPTPGKPVIHTIEWGKAQPGSHSLMAVAVASDGSKVVSKPVAIKVVSKSFVQVASPVNGSTMTLGESLVILAQAGSAEGTIQRLDILVDGQLLASTKLGELSAKWVPEAVGPHAIVARALDANGIEILSAPVKVLVRDPGADAFVRRVLPAAYVPGASFTVVLAAEPPTGSSAYALEDQPPKGWAVGEVSDEGAFDPVTGKVKFGPFTDGQARKLAYTVTAPNGAAGPQSFSGLSSIGGRAYPVAGDTLINPSPALHPADNSPADNAITLTELTGYAGAWKEGSAWPVGPNPIPLSFVTRAGTLWKQGEAYKIDPAQGAPPLCWVSPARRGLAPQAVGPEGTAVRSVVQDPNTGAARVEIQVAPGSNAAAYAVEEFAPVGWTVSGVSEGGVGDRKTGSIRWGLFLDNQPRSLTYQLLPPAGTFAVAGLKGLVSFDGSQQTIEGVGAAGAEARAEVRFRQIERHLGRGVLLRLGGSPDEYCVLEVSNDLKTWTELKPIFLPGGEIGYMDEGGDTQAQRFYRTRAP